MKYVRIGVLGFAALLLASCSVGPKYARPVGAVHARLQRASAGQLQRIERLEAGAA